MTGPLSIAQESRKRNALVSLYIRLRMGSTRTRSGAWRGHVQAGSGSSVLHLILGQSRPCPAATSGIVPVAHQLAFLVQSEHDSYIFCAVTAF